MKLSIIKLCIACLVGTFIITSAQDVLLPEEVAGIELLKTGAGEETKYEVETNSSHSIQNNQLNIPKKLPKTGV